jgi:hypothetical protein
MGSRKRHPAFEPSELDIIDRVYRAAWAQILARHPGRELENNRERQEALRRRLFILADRRPIEFDTLRDRVLVSMPETLMSDPQRRGGSMPRTRRFPSRSRKQVGATASAK